MFLAVQVTLAVARGFGYVAPCCFDALARTAETASRGLGQRLPEKAYGSLDHDAKLPDTPKLP